MSVEIWQAADLNSSATGGAAAASAPVPYLTDFANQGPTARVVYLGIDNHIWELYYIGSEAKWVATDLNGAAGGEAAAAWPAPVPYLTDFANQGPTARVLYLGTDNHIWELYYVGSTARWEPADLYWAAFPHAAPATAAPVAYLTDFANQGPTARVVYQAEGQNVLELAYAGAQSGALVVQKGAGMQVTSNAATLAGDVNAGGAPAAYFFEYGTTTTYGNVAPSPPPAVITTLPGMFSSANQAISGLQPATTYHFRLAAKYAQVPGQDWTYGADASFRTAGPPPPVVVPALVGQTLANALNVLQRLGFSLAGTIMNETPNQIQNTLLKVVSQSPQQGTRVAPGTAVNLVVTAINTTIQGYSQIEVDNANDDGQPVDIYLINLATNVSQKVGTVQFNQQATYTLQNGVEYEIVAVDVTLENCPGSDPTILSCQKTLTYASGLKGGPTLPFTVL